MDIYHISAILIVVITIISLSLFVRKYKKKATAAIEKAKQFNAILTVLNKKANTEVYLFDFDADTIQLVDDGELTAVPRKEFDMNNRLHPDDLERYRKERILGREGQLNESITHYRMLNPETNDYNDYEFVITAVDYNSSGKVSKFMFSKRDITEQMNLLREKENTIDSMKFSMSTVKFLYWKLDVATQIVQGVDNNFEPIQIPLRLLKAFVKEEDKPKMEEFYHELLDTKKRTSVIVHFKYTIDGEYCPYEMTAAVICDESGNPVTIYGVSKDISDMVEYKEKLEEKVVLLEAIKDYLPLGMAFFDKEGLMREVNNKHVEMFGTKKELALKSKVNLFNFNYIPQEAFDRLRKGEYIQYTISSETIHERLGQYSTLPTGLNRTFDMRYSPIFDKKGDIMGYISLFDDKTEEHNLMQALTEARNKAVESEQLKMAFLANMSHEIRTPLNAIIGFTELIQYCEDPEEKQEYMNIINSNNELLLRLINDILDLSKIESGMIDLKRKDFDLSTAFEETYVTFRNKNSNPNLVILKENPYNHCNVCLDKNRFLQIMINFTTNAMKHTKQGSVTMGYTYKDEGIYVYVKDTGAGIPKEKQHLIFKRFQKLDSFVQGIGLGLTICKAIIDAVGGKIGFESEEGKGTTFWAWVPAQAQVTLRETETKPV